MARNQKRHQAALERKAAKRKQQRSVARVGPSSHRAVLRTAAKWPVHECLVSSNWRQEAGLVQVLVARRSPSGQVATAVFLVDLGCLGVKDAFTRVFASEAEYRLDFRQLFLESQPVEAADLNLAAKIIREAIAYARALGFSPHRDYHEAASLLEGANPDASDARIPLGKDGKPFYVAGPYDNVERIMAQLTKAVGPDKFQLLAPVGALPELSQVEEDEE